MRNQINPTEESMVQKNPNGLLKIEWGAWFFLGLAAILAVMLGPIGCSNNPVSDQGTGLTTEDSEYNVDRALDAIKFADSVFTNQNAQKSGLALSGVSGGVLVAQSTTNRWADPNGFPISMGIDDQWIYMEFPKGAVTAWNITIRIDAYKYETPNGPVYMYECSPHGLVFKKPVKVVHGFPNNGKKLAGLFYNYAADQWRLEQVSSVNNCTATFQIYHFSKYGISE